MSAKRFRIAFSFAGVKRDFVAKVAAILARRFSQADVLYDKFHEAEFARAISALICASCTTIIPNCSWPSSARITM